MSKFSSESENYWNENLPEKTNIELDKFIPKEQQQDSDVWDFTKITIKQLGIELEEALNRKTPIFLWSKERLNTKLRLDNEKLVILLEKIKILRSVAAEFSQLQADAIFSEQFIKNLVAEKYMIAEQFFEKAKEKHYLEMLTMRSQAEHIKLGIDERKLDLKEKEARIRKLNAEAAQEEAKAKTEEAKAKSEEAKAKSYEERISLIDLLSKSVDFKNLPSSYQTYLLAAFINVDINSITDFDIKEKMKEIIIQQAQAEANKKDAEANSAKADTDLKFMKNEQIKKDAGL